MTTVEVHVSPGTRLQWRPAYVGGDWRTGPMPQGVELEVRTQQVDSDLAWRPWSAPQRHLLSFRDPYLGQVS